MAAPETVAAHPDRREHLEEEELDTLIGAAEEVRVQLIGEAVTTILQVTASPFQHTSLAYCLSSP